MMSKPRPSGLSRESLTAESLWSAALPKLQGEVPRPAFDTWLRDLEPLSFASNRLTLAAGNAYARDRIQEYYARVIERVLEEIAGAAVDLSIVCPGLEPSPQRESHEPDLDLADAEATQDLSATIHPRYLSAYDEVVRPERVIAFPSYYLRWLPYLGVDLAWLPIGFRQVGYFRGMDFEPGEKFKASGREIARWSGMSLSTFRRRANDPLLRWFVKPTGAVRQGISWTLAADGRPHQETAEWEVVMSMPLTPHDQESLRGWFQGRLNQGLPPSKALQLALELPVSELLPLPGDLLPPEVAGEPRSVQDVVKEILADRVQDSKKALGDLANALAQQIAGPPILVSHYFVRNWIPLLGAGPAWMVTVLRSRKPVTAGSEFEIEIAAGYDELATLLGLSNNWTIARWLRKGSRPAMAIRRFVEETGAIRRPDNRVSRQFRVTDLEPLLQDGPVPHDLSRQADGTTPQAPRAPDTRNLEAPRVNDTRRGEAPRADDTRIGLAPRAGATRRAEAAREDETRRRSSPRAHDTVGPEAPRAEDTVDDQSLRGGDTGLRGGGGTSHLSEKDADTSSSSSDSSGVSYADRLEEQAWVLATLLVRARVNPRARVAVNGASGAAFVSWMLYAASARGKSINDPVGHAVSRLRSEPHTGAGAVFDRLADLGPGGLIRLLGDPATARYSSRDWAQAMEGADQGRVRALWEMLGGVEDEEEDPFWEDEEE